MNPDTERKILRQLKFLNFWMALFGTLLITFIIGTAFVGYQLLSFANKTTQQINEFKQTTTQKLDVKSQVCGGTDSFSSYLRNNTTACQ